MNNMQKVVTGVLPCDDPTDIKRLLCVSRDDSPQMVRAVQGFLYRCGEARYLLCKGHEWVVKIIISSALSYDSHTCVEVLVMLSEETMDLVMVRAWRSSMA